MYVLSLRQRQYIASTLILNNIRFSSSLKQRKEDEDEKNEKEKIKMDILEPKKKSKDIELPNSSILSKYLPDVQKSLLGGRSDAPMNWNYPNKKFVDDFKIEAKMGDVVKEMPDMTKKEMSKLKKEVANLFDNPLEKPDMLASLEGLKHDEAIIEYEFKHENSLDIWQTGCDADWNQGYSKVELIRSPRDTAIFKGYLNTEVVKDGKTKRAGWASMKTVDTKAFDRKKHLWWWKNYSHLLIKCRGDGRSYKVMLYVPGAIDLTWGDTYSYPLHTHGGPYWQYEKIPFSRFLHTVGGRIQDNQRRVFQEDISAISIGIMDRIDGEFELEVDYIGCYNDTTHEEKFAYETYSIPMFNPQTI